MKKKILAMLLAAVMVMALLPTAFAADEDRTPGIYTNLKDGASETLRREGKTFSLRGWDAVRPVDGWTREDLADYWEHPENYPDIDDPFIYTLTRGEPEDFDFSHYYELPLGVTLTIDTVLDEYGYPPVGNIAFYAWSDPDDDGVYDQWIGITDPDTNQDVPYSPSEQEPIETYDYTGYFYLAFTDWMSYFLYCPIQGLGEPLATAQITSDYLTEYFGVNTLIEVRVATDIDAETEETKYSYYDFLLTGEQVDPGLLDGAPDPEPTEPEPETPATSFTDVKPGEWYTDAVAWAAEKGITNGYPDGTFGPEDSCTRAEIVTFLWRAYGSEEPASTANPFTDVSESAFYYKAVLWAYENNITTGNPDGTFSPNGRCTREQAVTFQYRAAGSPAVTGGSSFTDVDAGAYYADAVSWAAENDITNGYPGNIFAPGEVCTRGHIVTFLYRELGE